MKKLASRKSDVRKELSLVQTSTPQNPQMKKIVFPNRKLVGGALVAVALSLGLASMQAQTSYDAVAANADGCHNGDPNLTGFAVLLPALDPNVPAPNNLYKFVFSPAAGTFTQNPDGTARLTGSLVLQGNPTYGFNLDITFTGRTTNPALSPANYPKELKNSCYVPGFGGTGGPVDPRTFDFYSSYAGGFGTLTGTGQYAGVVIRLDPKPFTPGGFVLQVGHGASGKNVRLGASGWFMWDVVQQPSGRNLRDSYDGTLLNGMPLFGDFAINLNARPSNVCTRTPGYWKNHPNAWPVQSLVVGGVTYSKKQALSNLNTPKATGDATKILIFHLIAAKLNVLAGTDSGPIAQTISAADAFLVANPLNSDPKGAKRDTAISLAATLDK